MGIGKIFRQHPTIGYYLGWFYYVLHILLVKIKGIEVCCVFCYPSIEIIERGSGVACVLPFLMVCAMLLANPSGYLY